MASPDPLEVARYEQDRAQNRLIVRRQNQSAQPPKQPAFYLGYDADTEQHLVQQGERTVPARQILTNAGLSAGQPVEFVQGNLDGTPLVRRQSEPPRVLPAPESRWSVIFRHLRRTPEADRIKTEFVYWEYSHTGQIRELLVIPDRAELAGQTEEISPLEEFAALDDRGTWMHVKAIHTPIVNGLPVVDEARRVLYHTLNAEPQTLANSWRRDYVNSPQVWGVDAPYGQLPGSSYHPCIRLYIGPLLGAPPSVYRSLNVSERELLLFDGGGADIGVVDAEIRDGLAYGGQMAGTASVVVNRLGTSESGTCQLLAPQTVVLPVPEIPLSRFGIEVLSNSVETSQTHDLILLFAVLYFEET